VYHSSFGWEVFDVLIKFFDLLSQEKFDAQWVISCLLSASRILKIGYIQPASYIRKKQKVLKSSVFQDIH
jgi:hypothetical protein